MSQPIPNIQKLNVTLYKNTQVPRSPTQDCFTRYQGPRKVILLVLHLMRIIQFGTQTNLEIKMSQPIPNIQNLNTYKKYSTSGRTNPGLLLQILGTQESYSRVLHLMRIIQFGTQTNSEIKMSQPIPNIQKLNTYKKYSTSSSPSTQDCFSRYQGPRKVILGCYT